LRLPTRKRVLGLTWKFAYVWFGGTLTSNLLAAGSIAEGQAMGISPTKKTKVSSLTFCGASNQSIASQHKSAGAPQCIDSIGSNWS
jgi:hypothetical protein